MLTVEKENRHKWRLWVIVALLVLLAALAFIWPDPGVGERVSNTQNPAQDVVWRQCNPTTEALRAQEQRNEIESQAQDVVWRECNPTTEALRAAEQRCDIQKQDATQDVVWRECNPETEAQCTQKPGCAVPTPVPVQDMVWRQCNPTIEVARAEAISWNIPEPTLTVWTTCDCILTQMPTPWATGTPDQKGN